jgi:hypothetical protein
MPEPERRRPLPSFSGASRSIGTFLAGLEQQILHRRPPAAIVLEEEQRAEDRVLDGLKLEQTHDPVERPEPPDRSGARL